MFLMGTVSPLPWWSGTSRILKRGAAGVAQVVVGLAHSRSWAHAPASLKSEVVVHACKPGTQEEEAGGSDTQSHPRLRSEFQTIVGCNEDLSQINQSVNQSISQSIKGLGTPDPYFRSIRIITVIKSF